MPEFSIVLLDEAWRDIDKISDYFHEKLGTDAALSIASKFLDEIKMLANFPLSGPPIPDPDLAILGYRMLVLTRTYIAVYKIVDSTVYIYRIVNGRTDYPKLLK